VRECPLSMLSITFEAINKVQTDKATE
jgi:hypothetical protein